MKITEWFLAIFIMAMGILCLLFSATSFQGVSFAQLGLSLASLCSWMAAMIVVIGIIYFIIIRKRKRGKK
ncbi:hypothetical protein D3C76_206530 [compost metagenome]